jgi:hypothetical protein
VLVCDKTNVELSGISMEINNLGMGSATLRAPAWKQTKATKKGFLNFVRFVAFCAFIRPNRPGIIWNYHGNQRLT